MPAPARALLLAIAAGVAVDAGLRGSGPNAVIAAALGLAVIALATDRRLPRREARLLALAALAPIALLAVRTSPWLLAANLAAAAALVGAALAVGRSGSILDTTPARLLARLLTAIGAASFGLRAIASLVPRPGERQTDNARAVVRAVLIAGPILAVVVALLASADAVFAGLLTPDLDAGPLIGHLILLGGGTLVVLLLIGAATADPVDPAPAGRFGAIEVVTMLALAALVLGAFSAAQVIAATGAGDRLVAEAGRTPAEYARSGFFQLCWATAILLGFLALVRGLARPSVLAARPVRVLGALVPLLALGLVGVSLQRLARYDEAFGLTMLRLTVVAATVWFGIVFVLVAARNLGLGASRHWVLAASGAAAIGLVLLGNGIDAEAFVARHNLARADDGAEVDLAYLATLSDDAVPTLAAALDREADPARRAALLDAVGCGAVRRGVTLANLAAVRAEAARDRVCDDGDGEAADSFGAADADRSTPAGP